MLDDEEQQIEGQVIDQKEMSQNKEEEGKEAEEDGGDAGGVEVQGEVKEEVKEEEEMAGGDGEVKGDVDDAQNDDMID